MIHVTHIQNYRQLGAQQCRHLVVNATQTQKYCQLPTRCSTILTPCSTLHARTSISPTRRSTKCQYLMLHAMHVQVPPSRCSTSNMSTLLLSPLPTPRAVSFLGEPRLRSSSLETGIIGTPPPVVRRTGDLFTAAEVERLLAVRDKQVKRTNCSSAVATTDQHTVPDQNR